MNLKFGKKPADTAAFAAGLKFGAMTDSELPEPPLLIGRARLIGNFGMLGNDQVSNCVITMGMHRIMQWRAVAGQPVPRFTTADAIDDYSAITGYVPGDAGTDQGTSMIDAVAYQKTTGYRDARNARHTVEGSLFLRPGDVTELAKALYWFGAIDIGVQLSGVAMDQYNNEEPWSATTSTGPTNGHGVTVIARNSEGSFECVTWPNGKRALQAATPPWIMANMDEGFAYYSADMLRSDQLSPRGIDKAGLLATLGKL